MNEQYEVAHLPFRKTWQSQGMGVGSHEKIKAIDLGKLADYPNETKAYASFTGKIVYKGAIANGNGTILESVNKVFAPDGVIDYMCVVLWHDNDISDIQLGKVYKQDEKYYDMGTANAPGQFHCHLEVIRGKYKGWNGTTSNGSLKFINAIEPYKALFLTEDTILKYSDYPWKRVVGTPISKNEKSDQIEVLAYDLNCRSTPNGSVLGYINKGTYNILESVKNGSYTWYKVEEGKYIAYDPKWAIIRLKTSVEDMQKQILELKEVISIKDKEILSLKTEISKYTPIQAYVKKD
jgi:hypothetical protein